MSAIGLATLGVVCNKPSIAMATLGLFCGKVEADNTEPQQTQKFYIPGTEENKQQKNNALLMMLGQSIFQIID